VASYRFCRSDDAALLVAAYNACFLPHRPELPELTPERFRAWIRREDLWTSSCMVAHAGDRPVGVLLAAKREQATRILAVGVAPGYEGQGHGKHLLQSLSAKLAILGPPTLLAEVGEADAPALGFLRACGYAETARYHDFTLERPERRAAGHPLVGPLGVEELRDAGAFDDAVPRAWERMPRALLNRRDELSALAVAAGERVEAHLVYHDRADGAREILALASARGEALLGLLLDEAAASAQNALLVPRAHPAEIPYAFLESRGFVRGAPTLGLATTASAA